MESYGTSWELDSEGTLTISGSGSMPGYMTVSDPPWGGYLASIKKVITSNGLTNVGTYAFAGCTNLTSVTIGSSVDSIGECAFEGCTALTSLVIPNNVTTIYSSAFARCANLESVVIGTGVKQLSASTFTNCTKLTVVTILGTLTKINSSTFNNCNNLWHIFYGGDESSWNNLANRPTATTMHYNCTGSKITPATCTTPMTCTECNDTHGSALGHSLAHHEATAATLGVAGNVEYWQCSTCSACFLDAGAATPVALESTVILAFDVDLSTTVIQYGSEAPGSATFAVEPASSDLPSAYANLTVTGGSTITNGAGNYVSKMTISGTADDLRACFAEKGACFRQSAVTEDGWACDDTVWAVVLTETNAQDSVGSGYSMLVYPSKSEPDGEGWAYVADDSAGPVSAMSFTNSYGEAPSGGAGDGGSTEGDSDGDGSDSDSNGGSDNNPDAVDNDADGSTQDGKSGKGGLASTGDGTVAALYLTALATGVAALALANVAPAPKRHRGRHAR